MSIIKNLAVKYVLLIVVVIAFLSYCAWLDDVHTQDIIRISEQQSRSRKQYNEDADRRINDLKKKNDGLADDIDDLRRDLDYANANLKVERDAHRDLCRLVRDTASKLKPGDDLKEVAGGLSALVESIEWFRGIHTDEARARVKNKYAH